MDARDFVPLRVAVLTVSDTRTLDSDGSGRVIVEALEKAGHTLVDRKLVRDEVDLIRRTMRAWIGGDVEVVIATGGTGITGRDVTPEALAPLVDVPIPGFGELFRQLSYAEIGTSAIHTRAEAAVCGSTLVFLLPGSTGACRTAMTRIVIEQLDARHRPCNFVEMLRRRAEA
jgi:molybdenum cofactor biosynthesis protein B